MQTGVKSFIMTELFFEVQASTSISVDGELLSTGRLWGGWSQCLIFC